MPQEYSALKTLMVKGVGWGVYHKSEDDIRTHIESVHPNWKIEKIVKIPNNETLMKIICKSPSVAEQMAENGITIFSQRFDRRSLEREVYINITPCMRCYKYDHFTKKCKAPESYKICSECARTGHRFSECQSQHKKCINCGQSHRTEKVQKVPESDLRRAVEGQVREDLPDNYLAVVASAMVLADIREKECPGVYQYIVEEMYRANGLPLVKFPATVVAGYEHHRTKKRTREPSVLVQGVQEGEEQTEIMLQEQTELTLSELCRMETPTPIHSPASTPAATPAGTPVQSPQRVISVKRPEQQSVRVKDMKPPPGPQRKKEKKEEERGEVDAGIVLFTYRGSRLPGHKLDHMAKVGFLKRSKILKYIYRNKSLDRGAVWNMVLQKKN